MCKHNEIIVRLGKIFERIAREDISRGTMSEGCTSCRGANYAGNTLQLGTTPGGNTGSLSSTSGTNSTTTRRVQVRAKVLYGTGKAIASLQAQEKAARH